MKDLSQANLALTNDLATSRQESLDISNSLTASLATATATLADTKSSLAMAQSQITNLNVQVSDLEVQNKVLDERATELTNTIAQMNRPHRQHRVQAHGGRDQHGVSVRTNYRSR